jgi:predicted DCC family thiol-disulfide oxidoreductase YuxK
LLGARNDKTAERGKILLKKMQSENMITVFFDGKCGLCSKEINYYRKIAPDGIFIWQDITKSADDLKASGISLSQGLRLLHTKDIDGKFYVGVDAFILIWKQLKRWRLLAIFVSLPIIKQIINFAYKIFANWRFKRLKHCQLAEKQDSL